MCEAKRFGADGGEVRGEGETFDFSFVNERRDSIREMSKTVGCKFEPNNTDL